MPGAARGHAIEIAGDELEARVVKGGAAVVAERDPAVEIGGFVVAIDGEDVVGIPRERVGEVRGFDLLLSARRNFRETSVASDGRRDSRGLRGNDSSRRSRR